MILVVDDSEVNLIVAKSNREDRGQPQRDKSLFTYKPALTKKA